MQKFLPRCALLSLAALVTVGLQNAAQSAPTAPAPGSWFVRLKVDDYAKGWKFNATVLGQQPRAAIAWDPQDLPTMAPFSSPYLYLTFPRPNWGAKAGDYTSDFRPAGRLISGDWPFELRASQIGSTVYLRYEGDPEIIKRSQLIDAATGKAISPASQIWTSQGLAIKVNATVTKFIWRYLGPQAGNWRR